MYVFNSCKTLDLEASPFESLWKVSEDAVGVNIGIGSHKCRHAHQSEALSGSAVYTSVANSIPELIVLAKIYLNKECIKDYEVSCLGLVELQLSCSNKFCNTTTLHIGRHNI